MTSKPDAANRGLGEPTADGGQPPAGKRQPATDPDSEGRRAELYARLLRAVEARRADRSAYYAPSLRHGLHCPDLDRSAAAAGENPEGLKAHLRLFDRVFGRLLGFSSQGPKAGGRQEPGADNRESSIATPQSPDPLPVGARSPLAPKLTRALALLMWLPMRLMRTQAMWERRALCYRLQELGRWRRRYGPLTPARIDRLRSDLDLLFNQHLDERAWLQRVRRRWLLLWEALFEPSAWAARLARWGRPGARKRTPASANSRSAPRAARREVWMRRLDELPPEAIANFSPGHALGAIEKRRKPASVKAPEQWSAWHERVARTLDRMDRRLRRATRDLFGARQPSDAELRGLVKRGKLKVPETFEEFEQLVAAALGPEPGHRDPGKGTGPVRSKGSRIPAGAGAAGSLARNNAAHATSLAETASSLPVCGTTPRKPDRLDHVYHSALQGKARRSAARSVPKKKSLNAPKLKTQGAHGSVDAPPGANPGPATENQPLATGPPSQTANHQFAEALWQRVNFFAGRADELEQLLQATLDWDTSRLPRLWWRLLPPDHAGECVMALLRQTDTRARALAARSGISLDEAWRRAEAESRPAAPWESAIDGRGHEPGRSRKSSVAGGRPGSKTRALLEMRKFMLDWQAAVDYTGHHANLSAHQVEVTLYDVAVYCFGIHKQFLEWRPQLSSVQLETRRERPEWQVRVMTADGEAWVKLSDGRIFRPEEEQVAGVSGSRGQGVQPGAERAVVGSSSRWFLGKWNFENRKSKFDILASGF